MEQRQIVDHPQIPCPLDNGQVIEREVDIPRIRHPVNMCVPADPALRFGVDESLGNQHHVTRLTGQRVHGFGGEKLSVASVAFRRLTTTKRLRPEPTVIKGIFPPARRIS